jgi:4-nitrophenyl phosphatase
MIAAKNGIQALILDMDGTLVRGVEPLPGLQNLFSFLQSRQLPFVIATNNATKSPYDYQQKLRAYGMAVSTTQILTAAEATAQYLQQELEPGAKLYIIGQPALQTALQKVGFCIISNATKGAAAVVVGGDPGLTYEKLKNATLLIQRGARLIGTNPDLVFPTEEGFVPETGTILAALQAATGEQPTVIGKPERYLFDMAVSRLGCEPAHTAVVGDRLDTDILGGQRAGLKTILTTTGIDNQQTIMTKGLQPDFIVNGLDELIQLLANHVIPVDADKH